MVGCVVLPKTILLANDYAFEKGASRCMRRRAAASRFCDAKTYVTPLDRTGFACYSKRTVCLEGMFSASGTQRQTEKDGAQCYHHPVCGPCGGVDPGNYGAQEIAQPAHAGGDYAHADRAAGRGDRQRDAVDRAPAVWRLFV